MVPGNIHLTRIKQATATRTIEVQLPIFNAF